MDSTTASSLSGAIINESELQEHPQGDEIRRQVEFYFSDENLEHDEHLRAMSGDSLNLPVSLNQVLGFKKMRQFKPKTLVIASLMKSPLLVINNTSGKRTIRRKTPFVPKVAALMIDNDPTPITTLPLKANEDTLKAPAGYIVDHRGLIVLPKAQPKKVQGFGDHITEGPLTPAEHAVEKQLYSIEHPAYVRLETAIQKYFHKRKFTIEKRQCLNAFLEFGGVSTGPRQFTGQSPQDIREMEKEQRKIATATHFIDDEKDDQSKWAVDFLGIAQDYFGSYFIQALDYSVKDIDNACTAIISFYDYLLYHDVCPEETVKSDMLAAKEFLQHQVKSELLLIKQIDGMLPGKFNRAAFITFIAKDWELADEQNDAQKIVVETLISIGNVKLGTMLESSAWKETVLLDVYTDKLLRIVDIRDSKLAGSEMGFLICQPVPNSEFIFYDLPDDVTEVLPAYVKIPMETEILHYFQAGLIFRADLVCADEEVWTLGPNLAILPSFYRFSLNSWSMGVSEHTKTDENCSMPRIWDVDSKNDQGDWEPEELEFENDL